MPSHCCPEQGRPARVGPVFIERSDPRSVRAWEPTTAAKGRPEPGQPPRGAATRVAVERGAEDRSEGPPQARSAPSGGSDPRSGGAWGRRPQRRAAPSQVSPPRGAATRVAAERGGHLSLYRSTPIRSSRSDTSSSLNTGLSSDIRRCLSSVGTGNNSSQRLATQPLSSHR